MRALEFARQGDDEGDPFFAARAAGGGEEVSLAAGRTPRDTARERRVGVHVELEKVVELVGEGGDGTVKEGLGEEGEAEGGGGAPFIGAGEGWWGEGDVLEVAVGVGDVLAVVYGSVEAGDADEVAGVVEVLWRGRRGGGEDGEEQNARKAEGYPHGCIVLVRGYVVIINNRVELVARREELVRSGRGLGRR